MRHGPLLVTFLTGVFLVAVFFIPHHRAQHAQSVILDWANVVYAFALILGSVTLWLAHQRRVMQRAPRWGYSLITLGALAFVTVAGVVQGVEEGTMVNRFYNIVNYHLASTMFALLAFFIASAAFRAFRARNTEATLLLVTAVVMMVGRVSVGEYVWSGFPALTEWLLDVPNLAAKRGIAIGIGLGAISTALKIILGIDRSYLGRS
jgi:cytochrome bd-type quinol oxidase subunit 2